jgi:hypothetical protein
MSIIPSRDARSRRGHREQAPHLKGDCPVIRDIEVIDAELREVTQEWRIAREVLGRTPSTDLLLDERAAARFTADCARLWDECCDRPAPILTVAAIGRRSAKR